MRLSRAAVVAVAAVFAIVAPLGAGAAATSSGVSPTTGAITGTVVDTSDLPLPGVCADALGAGGLIAGVGTTDANGNYLIAGVSPGTYTLDYSACSAWSPNVQAQFYDNTQDLVSAKSVTVVAGQSTPLNQQMMQPGGAISLTLVDSQGTPVSGLHVQAVPDAQVVPDIERNTIHWEQTDTSGTVVLRGLLPIDYTLSYQSCPHIFCAVVGYYKAQSWNGGSPTPVPSVPGTTTSRTDTLDVPTVTSSNVVVTASPNPAVAGQSVTLTAAVSDADGSIAQGWVDFSAYPAGASPVDLGQVQLGADGTASVTTSQLTAGSSQIYVYYYGYQLVAPSEGQVAVAVNAVSAGGGGGGGGGGSGGGGGTAPGSGTVPAGGSLSSDLAGTTPDPSNPLVVGVTSPTGGTVTIDKTAPDTAIGNYRVLNVGATITAPQASVADPLKLSFQVADAALPTGSYASDLTVFRDGTAISQCTKAGVALPDPCVTSTSTSGGVTTIDILSSHASTWDVEAADVGRIAGSDRIATAVAISRDSFPNGNAGAVVLARGDDYPDALVGAPLAAAKNAPLLLTQGATLSPATSAEISRVLPVGGTVYVLGSDAAIPAAVETQLSNAGFHVVRYGGVDRFATAVAVANALGDPSTVLLATGTNFPDALAAGPAAAHVHGAILLTNGGSLPPATSAYLASKATTVYAIGGPATAADPKATAVVGVDRFATATAVAAKFFTGPTSVGVATGASFPDALSGGAQLALTGSPLLLSAQDELPKSTTDYLGAVSSSVATVHVFGGTPTLSDSVLTQLRNLSAAG